VSSVTDSARFDDDPEDLPIEQAIEMFVGSNRSEWSESTIRDYTSRLGQFAAWCDDQGLETMGDLSGMAVERFKLDRQSEGLAPTTMKGQMHAVRSLLKYAHGIGAVDAELPYQVQVPVPDADDETDDTKLDVDEARRLLGHYRSSMAHGGSKEHVVLEVLWFTGCRLGGLRALDRSDYDRDEGTLRFRNRPPELPLKNASNGERVVGLSDPVCEVIDAYIAGDRSNKLDRQGRDPLICGRRGRPNGSTLQAWSYMATQPCAYRPCPHDKDRETCEYRTKSHASKCPSSRSPHQIRTGSITHQLNKWGDFELVAERVNANPETLRRYYDKASDDEQYRERRAGLVDELELSE
jgi:site-specific recombinase XerD